MSGVFGNLHSRRDDRRDEYLLQQDFEYVQAVRMRSAIRRFADYEEYMEIPGIGDEDEKDDRTVQYDNEMYKFHKSVNPNMEFELDDCDDLETLVPEQDDYYFEESMLMDTTTTTNTTNARRFGENDVFANVDDVNDDEYFRQFHNDDDNEDDDDDVLVPEHDDYSISDTDDDDYMCREQARISKQRWRFNGF